ncbi:9308_t:CDS:2, partial [Paraglomus brasilianum]
KFGGQSLQRLKTVSAFAPPKIQSNKNPSRVFLALESHSARADGHLSFNVGQRIEIADYSDDHDLLIGKLDNNVGGLIARDTLENCLHPEGSTENISNDLNTSTLVFNGRFRAFPTNDKSDFLKLRSQSGLAYFDRTGYISVLSSYGADVLLFLRPRRFGKSLALSMLTCFHGVEHKNNYDILFKGLAIDNDVQAGTVKPNQYLVLLLDFSGINRDPDPGIAKAGLFDMINGAIER